MGHKISKEQIDPGVKDHIMSFVGDIADLETEVNTDIISAVNSLMVDRVDNAENMGKLANAIGEPVTANHSVDEVVEGLGEMLSTFKTNMMNSGVVVESSDKFKQLIDKIKGLVAGEGGNSGIQFVEGTVENIVIPLDSSVEKTVITNLDFVPQLILFVCQSDGTDTDTVGNNAIFTNLFNSTYYTDDAGRYVRCEIDNISNDSFRIRATASYLGRTLYNNKYIAIGSGEEDNTLRDSLASILEDEGVDVTEEDDMASLITKVDEEFDRKNANIVLEVEGTCTFKELTNGVNIGFQPTNIYISLPYSSGYNGKHVRCFFQDKYTKQAVSLYIIDGNWEQNAYGIEPTTTGFYGYLGISVSDSTVVTYKACKYF